MISCQNSEGQNYEITMMLMAMKKKEGDMDMMEGGVEVKRLILARSRLPPEEVSGRVVSGRSSALLLLVISNIIVIFIIMCTVFRSSQGGPTAVPGMLVRSSVGRSVQRHKYY